jgi:hypothetical protein
MNLGKIGGELRLLKLTRRHVLVRLNNVAPRHQACHCFNRYIGALRLASFLVSLKLSVFRSQDRIARCADLICHIRRSPLQATAAWCPKRARRRHR